MRSNPVCSVPPWPLLLFLSSSRFLSELLSWLPFMVDIYLQFEKYVCFSEVIFGQYSITARRKKAKTPDKTAGHQSSLVRQFSRLASCSVTECGSLKTKSKPNSQFNQCSPKNRATGSNTHAYRLRHTYRHTHRHACIHIAYIHKCRNIYIKGCLY